MFLVFSNHFDVLISKIIFKKLKNINMYFDTKNYLKNNHTLNDMLPVASKLIIRYLQFRN